MTKLKFAILEDSPLLLKSLEEDLAETQLVEVIVRATNSTEFLEKIKSTKADALVLDIDLGGDSMTGLDIATNLKLPVLFVSGKTRDFYQGIEELNINSSMPVEHISKPITLDKLKKILPKFINEINSINRAKFIRLDFSDSKQNKIAIDTIVFIETETGNSGASNNKRIYFTDRNPETLFNFSLTKIEDKGFDKTQFIQIRSSHRVNADKIIRYNNSTHEIEVEVFKSIGKTEIKKLPVSENFRKDVSRFKK
jgi:DNA-binding LytR/AlgR family response regulator